MATTSTMDEELGRKVDLKHLLKRVEFTQEEIVDASVTQSKLYYDAGVLRVQCMHRKNAAEMELDLVRARISLIIRRKDEEALRNKQKGEKVEKKTESYLKDLITRNEKYQEALAKYNRAVEEEALSKMLIEAFDMRMQGIKVVANVAGMELAVESQMKKKQEEISMAEKRLRRHYRD